MTLDRELALMRRLRLSFLLVAFSGIAVSAKGQDSTVGPCRVPFVTDTTGGTGMYPVGDAADVYRSVLDLLFVDGDERPNIIVIHDRAENRSSLEQYCQSSCKPWTHQSKIDTATIVAFLTRSRERPRIIPFGYGIPIAFMSYQDRARVTVEGCAHLEKPNPIHPAGFDPFLSGFMRRYPGAWGLLTLTKIGFNPARDEALVQAAFMCGESCFSEEILFLRKIDQHWTVVERIPSYVEASQGWFGGFRYRGPAGVQPSESELLVSSAGERSVRARNAGDDEAIVYRTVLDSLYHLHGESPRRIVVTDRFLTGNGSLPAHTRQIDPSTLKSYKVLGTVRAPLHANLDLRAPVSMLPHDSFPALERIGDPLAKRAEVTGEPLELSPFWIAFAQRYPDAWGMVGFTRVAFNTGHTEALVFTNHACGDSCHNADTWLLERTGENWQIAERIAGEKDSNWYLDSLRYLGADADPRAHQLRRLHGVVVVAATGRALPGLHLILGRNLRSDSLVTDSAGGYSVDNISITGWVEMKLRCPEDPSREPILLARVQVHPGIDSTVNLGVDLRRCLRQKRAHPLVVGAVSPEAAKSTYPGPEDAAVYRGVLDVLYPAGGSSKGPILLQPISARACDHCVDAEMPRLIRQGIVDPSTAQSFSKLPNDPVWFRPKFEYRREVIILSPAEQKFLFEQANDVGGYDKKDVSLMALAKDAYPGADSIWSLSRVAFNDVRTEALVQVGTKSNYWLNGETMLLRKSSGGWRVARRHLEEGETSGERVGDRCEPTDAPSGHPSLAQLERFVGDAYISSVGASLQLRGDRRTIHLRFAATDTLHRFYWLPSFPGDKRNPIRLKNHQVLASVKIINDSTGKARTGIAGTFELSDNTATITFTEFKEGYITFDGWFEQYKIMKVDGRGFFGNWFTESGPTVPFKGYFCGTLP